MNSEFFWQVISSGFYTLAGIGFITLGLESLFLSQTKDADRRRRIIKRLSGVGMILGGIYLAMVGTSLLDPLLK